MISEHPLVEHPINTPISFENEQIIFVFKGSVHKHNIIIVSNRTITAWQSNDRHVFGAILEFGGNI